MSSDVFFSIVSEEVLGIFHLFEFATFFFFLAMNGGICDLSSLTRDPTHASNIGNMES